MCHELEPTTVAYVPPGMGPLYCPSPVASEVPDASGHSNRTASIIAPNVVAHSEPCQHVGFVVHFDN